MTRQPFLDQAKRWFQPDLPFVWPEPRILEGGLVYRSQLPFDVLLQSATSLLGITYGLDGGGITWLRDIIRRSAGLRCRLVLAVYAACPTSCQDLTELLELEKDIGDHVSFRILPVDLFHGAPANTMYCSTVDNPEGFLLAGPSVNFGISGFSPAQANLVFRPDPVLREAWYNWFKWIWAKSASLSPSTLDIPPLIPARGSEEAAALWDAYVTQCLSGVHDGEKAAGDVMNVDERTGKVTVRSATGAEKPTVTEEVGVPHLDELAERLVRIYGLGEQVTIVKESRLGPLDAPVNPRHFGLDSFRTVGAIRREVRYRVSVIDEQTLRAIDNKKKMTRVLLERMSFPLADGVRWMPRRARPLFEKELKRTDDEGKKMLGRVLGDNSEALIAGSRERIVKDLNSMYQEFFPGNMLSEETVNEILGELAGRLKKATVGRFLPDVTYSPVGFQVTIDSPWHNPWGQALTLLCAVAEFPRKALTDRFFFQGLRIDENELMDAMNVCDDWIYGARYDSGIWERAREELAIIGRIRGVGEEADGSSNQKLDVEDCKQRCKELLDLMAGERRGVG